MGPLFVPIILPTVVIDFYFDLGLEEAPAAKPVWEHAGAYPSSSLAV